MKVAAVRDKPTFTLSNSCRFIAMSIIFSRVIKARRSSLPKYVRLVYDLVFQLNIYLVEKRERERESGKTRKCALMCRLKNSYSKRTPIEATALVYVVLPFPVFSLEYDRSFATGTNFAGKPIIIGSCRCAGTRSSRRRRRPG